MQRAIEILKSTIVIGFMHDLSYIEQREKVAAVCPV